MACGVCAFVRQYVLNLLIADDKLTNTIAGGDPNETISRRVARAAEVGERWATVICSILGFFSKNHCAFALTPGTEGKELLPLSDNFSEPDLR